MVMYRAVPGVFANCCGRQRQSNYRVPQACRIFIVIDPMKAGATGTRREQQVLTSWGSAHRVMDKSKVKTALHWLLPSMARDGLVKNGDWVLPAAAEAASLFSDPELQLPAQFLAVLNRFALDYIKQAPVLVVAASHGARLLYRQDRATVGQRFIGECDKGLKLPALMQAYGLAAQTRAVCGLALRHDQRDVLVALSKAVPASTLAQNIPKQAEEQLVWLQSLERWRSHMGRHMRSKDLFLDWAAINIRDAQARAASTDVADFAGRNRATFNLSWNFAQALAASQRWHAELAVLRPAVGANRPDWRTMIDYAPLPTHIEIDGFGFHALQTREALFEEGAQMHHCVRLYSDKVVRGSSRIYSVQANSQRIATLELVRVTRPRASGPSFRQEQLKGPRNARPAGAVLKAAAVFLASVNRAGSGGDCVIERGDRASEELRSRFGEEVFSSWLSHIQFGAFDGKVLCVTLPTKFLRSWVQTHYLDAVLASCAGEFPGVEKIEAGLRSPAVIAARPSVLGAMNLR
jgi:hypothetical protein